VNQQRQAARRPPSPRTKRMSFRRRVRRADIAHARACGLVHGPATFPSRAAIEACLEALNWPWSAKLSLLLDQAVIAEESAGDRAWNS